MNEVLKQYEHNVCILTINREQAMNALNHNVIDELNAAIDEIEAKTDELRGLIITGAGPKSFVAGADISEFVGLSRKEGIALGRKGQMLFSEIEKLNIPVIAAVNGFALGGGCELAMACHIRVAGSNAKFGQPEVNLGLIPGYGGTQRLIHYIGKGKAMELLMTSDMIDAATAHQLGLVNDVTTRELLIEKCKTIINKIASVSPVAVAGIVKCVDAYYEPGIDGFNFEAEEFGRCFAKDDVKEVVSAFLEKRKANFKR